MLSLSFSFFFFLFTLQIKRKKNLSLPDIFTIKILFFPDVFVSGPLFFPLFNPNTFGVTILHSSDSPWRSAKSYLSLHDRAIVVLALSAYLYL